MKKSLIALAALAATASFAQSSVTLSGLLDFAGANVNGTQIGSNGSTFSTTTGTSSTSVIRIDAVEDLGGGMKASVRYALDPRTLSNDSLAFTAAANDKATKNVVTGVARDEVFVGIEGAFGNVRLGSPNSIGLTTFLAASPLGTGVGSGYAPNAGTMTNSFVNTRYNRSARYDSPNFAGFTVSALYAPGNDEVAVDAVAATQIPNARQTTELAIGYANGPLSISVANIAQDAQVNKTGWYSGSQTAAIQQAKTSMNIVNASYSLGNTTLYAGWNKGDRLAASSATSGAAVESKGSRIAAKHNIGAVALIAQYTTQEVSNVKAKVTGLRADYSLSKTAALYVGYEKWDTGAAAAAGTDGATAGVTGDRKITSVGLRKSF